METVTIVVQVSGGVVYNIVGNGHLDNVEFIVRYLDDIREGESEDPVPKDFDGSVGYW